MIGTQAWRGDPLHALAATLPREPDWILKSKIEWIDEEIEHYKKPDGKEPLDHFSQTAIRSLGYLRLLVKHEIAQREAGD